MQEVNEFFRDLFNQSLWPARWHCGYWSDFHGWLYIVSDLFTWAAYFTIPVLILKHVSRKKNIRFHSAYIYFAAFILACGLTHLLDAAMFWFPLYRINALVRLFTALISWFTVYHLFKLLPTITGMKSSEELETEVQRNALLLAELENSNQALKKQNALIENIFNATVDHATVFDLGLNVISVSTATEKLLKKSKTELLGKNYTELFPGAIDSDYHQDLKTAISGVPIINKVGIAQSGRHYVSSFKPLYENEMMYGILVLSRDITDKVTREAELEQLNKDLYAKNEELIQANAELEQFTYILSHDLQAPLRKIQVYSALAAAAGPGLKDEQIQRVGKIAERMKVLITDVLDYTKSGKTEMNSGLVKLDEIVSSVLTDLELNIAEKKAQVKTNGLGTVNGIRYQLNQLFYNLIANAIKYCDKEPCLEIGQMTVTKRINGVDQQFVEISFKDNGIGFDEQYKDEIFSPFKRLQSDFEGTGIGLALVKRIIDNHGGYVEVESKVGEGSVFRIGLPL